LIKIMGRVEANFRSRNIRLSCSVLDASGQVLHPNGGEVING
jgi:hypothetical protein